MAYNPGVFVKQSADDYARYSNPRDKNENTGLDDLLSVWETDYKDAMKTSHAGKMYGTSIPYLFNIVGDLLINPSTVSPSTFRKMVETDNIVGACQRYNVDSIINSIADYVHPNPDIQHAIRYSITRLERGWTTFIRDILTAIYAGFSYQEILWEYDEILGGDIIRVSMPLPQNTLIARVTPQGAIQSEGIGQYVFNSFFPGYSALFSYGIGNVFAPLLGNAFGGNGPAQEGPDPYASTGDLDYPYRTYMISPIGLVWIPLDKTIRYEYYNSTNNVNPYGKSQLRMCYQLWVTKQAIWQFMLRAIRTKSAPFLALFGRPDALMGDYNANSQTSINNVRPTTVVDGLAAAVEQLDSTGAIVLAGMPGELADIKSFPNEANIDVMIESIKYIDECIMSCMMVPRTVFGGGGESSGSFSLAQSHQDSHHLWVMSVREELVHNVLIKQYVKRIIEENFTEEEHEHDWGDFATGLTNIDEQLKQAQIFNAAIEGGYVNTRDINDLNRMREDLDFNIINETELAKFLSDIDKSMEKAQNKTASGKPTDREVKDSASDAYAHK